jgi:murein DD-endopeptidase MepM/ murein hydrolase activator NlpD
VGTHVVFGAGRYAPGSAEGNRLIAHELAHVVQQRGAPASLQPSLEIGAVDDAAEREADAAARAVGDGGGSGPLSAGGAALRRWPTGEPGEPARPVGLTEHAFNAGRRGARAAHGTMGYREAHEYSECLRIMGAENTAYCREQVLGIRPPAPPSRRDPLSDMSTFQSPGASGWWGARFGCYRSGCTRRHRGWDLHATTGTPVLAAESGQFRHLNDPGGYGTYLMLSSSRNPDLSFLYGHLSAREPAGSCSAGQQIGLSGISGNASADRPHLHFEVRQSGTAVDPAGYFTEPSQVIETAGTAATAIDRNLPAPCAPC